MDGPMIYRYVELLAPDRVAVVFDGSRSWESRREFIDQVSVPKYVP